MDTNHKYLAKLSPEDFNAVKAVLEDLAAGKTKHLNIKKLRGHSDIYRIRNGSTRIIFRKTSTELHILSIGHRKDVYKNLKN